MQVNQTNNANEKLKQLPNGQYAPINYYENSTMQTQNTMKALA